MVRQLRRQLLNCAAILAIAPVHAYAQPVAPTDTQTSEKASTADSNSDIVVTGSRIKDTGYNSPVPVSVLGSKEINAQKPSNITDVLYTLPSVSTSTQSAQNSSPLISCGCGGVSTINMRGLGATRTLVLIDGRRTPPSTFGGIVDINTMPQNLIERVEIVTGGASA